MAMQGFTELLHKLKEVHEQEVEGWQEKVLELTNKKTCDAKRLEELYSRNQQLREQQKILTDNIKQLENMLRAGLCDRCTVSQDMAKKQQQDFESAQLQSLQHITLLMGEISALMKDNEKLKEEVKSLRGRIEKQNGHPEDARSPEVKRSPDHTAARLTPVTSVLKPELLSAGGATASAATVKSESESKEAFTERKEMSDKGAVHKRLQEWSGAYPFESNKLSTLMNASNTNIWRERRSASVDSLEPRPSPPSPTIPSHLRLLKKNLFLSKDRPQRVSAPLRPHPIKTAPPSLHWPLPERKDWAMMATVGAHPNISQDSRSTLLHFAGLVPPTGPLEPRSQSQESIRPVCPPHRSICELGESRNRERGATVSVIAPPSWKAPAVRPEQVFGESLREGEEEAPLDLSSAGGCTASDTERTETAQKSSQPQSNIASPSSSSSSSSPPAPLSSPSSAQYASSPQSDPQTADTKPQREETWEKQKTDSVQEKEKQENGQFSENLKVPTLTISLRPVVVLESLKTAGQNEQDMGWSSSPQDEEEVEDEENNQSTAKKRPGQDNEAVSSRRPLKEKRTRLTATPQGPDHGDSDQG
uniref:Retinoblastoma binding protein 8-like n=1 Tax=Astyanax mexicanus TaxID=7994 RepID=W5K6J3_ASTMX